MNDAIKSMLAPYKCNSTNEYENALKEVIQEIALLGLWRAKFFEHAAFYGGTALRIFYGLNRFSEDLDFSLLKPNNKFVVNKYYQAIEDEIKSFGFHVTVDKKGKSIDNPILSAFIKAGTKQNLINILTDKTITAIPSNKQMKIKIELDTNPPLKFETEAKHLLQPIPFSVNIYKPSDLFAGKLHAVLCRSWKTRVKGRDWYDLVWYIGKNIPVHLIHLEERMKQTGHLSKNDKLTEIKLQKLLAEKIENVDYENAKKDVLPMLKDIDSVKIWSSDFFKTIVQKIKVC